MKSFVAGMIVLILFAFFAVVAMQLHPLGYPQATEMDDYFISNAQEETGANNVVAAVVFDYRGFDTMGEATVLFAAVTSVLMIFWGRS
ncbi:hypothetical protein K8R43_03010 [archaeon]|nr:hypothetical protein [archaeon]